MTFKSSEPGAYVSGFAHLALILSAFMVFSGPKPLEAPQESTPVDIVTDQQFNEMTKGEKTAKATKPTPPKADKAAEVEEQKPTPPVVAKVDTPTPPPPLKRIPDPGEDDDTPTPPRKMASLPPPAPTPPVKPDVKPPPPKAEKAPEPPPRPDAEVVEPAKTPTPPARPVDAKQRPAPKEEAKPKSDAKPLDKVALAKLLDSEKSDDTPKPASRPKSGDETNETKHKFDTAALSKLLSKDDPGQKPSTARAVNQTASIGAATAHAAKMSPSLWAQLDGMLQDQYKKCWSYLGLSGETSYIPQIKVAYDQSGRLMGQPSLLNPPGDPAVRNLADSAMRAVRRCDPLRIPAQFAPYFDQWKERILRFDPEEMAG